MDRFAALGSGHPFLHRQDSNDAAVMRSVKESFDPENIVVVLNRAGARDRDGKDTVEQFSTVSLRETAISFFRDNSEVELLPSNVIVTGFGEDLPRDVHFEYIPVQEAFETIKNILNSSHAAGQLNRPNRKRRRGEECTETTKEEARVGNKAW